ncbi:MAG: type II toxin-antitoxin system RelE/ParE family toxin [Candidatus Aminicenantes bacterium]|nr:type II toxin-antitoxin system RelE/ParE family toxin [Candidatus Aminicenantes bacterium]
MVEVFLLPPAQKDLNGLEVRILRQIIKKIRALTDEPRPHGCLKLTAEEGYRIRAGDYRVLYRIDDEAKRIFIYRIKHRKDAYLE